MNNQQQQQLEQQRQIWNFYSGGWKKWDGFISREMTPVNKQLIECLTIRGDEHILDVASGPGEPGLSFSRLLPRGNVSAIDLSEKMVAIANEHARERDIKNYSSVPGDASQMPFGDNTFDAIVCRFGIMFFPDIKAGLQEFFRVLKPGGRPVVAVWSKPEANLFLSFMGRAIAERLQLPKPPPDAPGVFRCAMPGYTSQLFRDAGFMDVKEKEITGEMTYESPEQYWEMSAEIAGPLMEALRKAPAEIAEEVKQTVINSARNMIRDGKLTFGWSAIIATGVKV